jgi:hypothetical protein
MSDDAIVVHDEFGFTQAMRRQLLLLICDDAQARHAAEGLTLTWTEQPDGVTIYVDGRYDSRITYAELAAIEAHPEDCPAISDRRALVVCRCGAVVERCPVEACEVLHDVRLVEACGACTQTGAFGVVLEEEDDV